MKYQVPLEVDIWDGTETGGWVESGCKLRAPASSLGPRCQASAQICSCQWEVKSQEKLCQRLWLGGHRVPLGIRLRSCTENNESANVCPSKSMARSFSTNSAPECLLSSSSASYTRPQHTHIHTQHLTHVYSPGKLIEPKAKT